MDRHAWLSSVFTNAWGNRKRSRLFPFLCPSRPKGPQEPSPGQRPQGRRPGTSTKPSPAPWEGRQTHHSRARAGGIPDRPFQECVAPQSRWIL